MKLRNAAATRARQEPEYQLRHRVTGAVIIAVAAALVIVWLLGQAGPGAGTGGAASAPQTLQPDPRPPPAAVTLQGEDAGQAAAPEAALITPPANTGNPAQPRSDSASIPPTAATGWAVRVGAFSSQANIDSVTAKLTGLGFSVNTTEVKTAQGKDATRLWLGPYSSRQTAREVSERLQTSGVTGEKTAVVRHTPQP